VLAKECKQLVSSTDLVDVDVSFSVFPSQHLVITCFILYQSVKARSCFDIIRSVFEVLTTSIALLFIGIVLVIFNSTLYA